MAFVLWTTRLFLPPLTLQRFTSELLFPSPVGPPRTIIQLPAAINKAPDPGGFSLTVLIMGTCPVCPR